MRDPATKLALLDSSTVDAGLVEAFSDIFQPADHSVALVFYISRCEKLTKKLFGGPEQRVLLVSNRAVYICLETGERRRCIPLEKVTGLWRFADGNVALRVPTEYDVALRLERPAEVDYLANVLRVAREAKHSPFELATHQGNPTDHPGVMLDRPSGFRELPPLPISLVSREAHAPALLPPPPPPRPDAEMPNNTHKGVALDMQTQSVLSHPLFSTDALSHTPSSPVAIPIRPVHPEPAPPAVSAPTPETPSPVRGPEEPSLRSLSVYAEKTEAERKLADEAQRLARVRAVLAEKQERHLAGLLQSTAGAEMQPRLQQSRQQGETASAVALAPPPSAVRQSETAALSLEIRETTDRAERAAAEAARATAEVEALKEQLLSHRAATRPMPEPPVDYSRPALAAASRGTPLADTGARIAHLPAAERVVLRRYHVEQDREEIQRLLDDSAAYDPVQVSERQEKLARAIRLLKEDEATVRKEQKPTALENAAETPEPSDPSATPQQALGPTPPTRHAPRRWEDLTAEEQRMSEEYWRWVYGQFPPPHFEGNRASAPDARVASVASVSHASSVGGHLADDEHGARDKRRVRRQRTPPQLRYLSHGNAPPLRFHTPSGRVRPRGQ